MVIWSRWGILGLLIPIVLIFLAQAVMVPDKVEGPKPVKVETTNDPAEDAPTAEELEEKKAAQRKRDADHLKTVKGAKNNAIAVGCLIAAGVLWPLGRWMNTTDSRLLVDERTGQSDFQHSGGGHSLFFIPMQFWAFIWLVIGLFKLLS